MATGIKPVLESTGNLRLRINENLEEYGVKADLSNPNETRAIVATRIKTDRPSAQIHALLLRVDIIAECGVSSRDINRCAQPKNDNKITPTW
jgi:hypothetical protein